MKLNETFLPSQEKIKSEEEEEEEEEDDEKERLIEHVKQETINEKDILKRHEYHGEVLKIESTQKNPLSATLGTAQGIKQATLLSQDFFKGPLQGNLTNAANANNFIQAGNFNLINFANLPNFNPNTMLQQLTNVQKGVVPTALGSVYNLQNNEPLHATNNMFLSQFNPATNTKLLNDLIQIQQQQQLEMIIKELLHQQQLQLIQQQSYQQMSNNTMVNGGNNFNPCYLLLNHQNQLQQQQQQQNFRQNQQFMPIVFNSNTSFHDSDQEKSELVLTPKVAPPSSSPQFTNSDQLACICIDYSSNSAANKDVSDEISQKTQVFSLKKAKVIVGRKVSANITENNNSNASSVADISIENSTLVSRQHFSLELKTASNIASKSENQESSPTLIYWQLYCMSKNGLFVNTRYIETGKLIKLMLNKKYTFRFPNTNIRIHFESPPYEKLILTSFFNKNTTNHSSSQVVQTEKNSSSTSLSSVSSLSSISSNNSSTSSSPNPTHQVQTPTVIQQPLSSQTSQASSMPISHQPTTSSTHSSNKIAQILMQKQMEMLQQQHNTLKSFDSNQTIKSNQSFNPINDDDSSSSRG